MIQFVELYNNSQNLLQNIETINQQAGKINIENFRTLKAVGVIKQLVNNTLAETIVLSDFLHQLSIIENDDELKEFLDLIELDENEGIDIEVPDIDLMSEESDETD
jgi:hypothetical protein